MDYRDPANMKIQRNFRIRVALVEKLMLLKISSGRTMEDIVNEALEQYLDLELETPTVEQDLSDAEIVAKKEDLEPAKPLNNEEKNGQDSGQITLDMSKLQLEAGGNNDDYI